MMRDQEDLTERDLVLLDAIGKREKTTPEIVRELSKGREYEADSYEAREALIGLLGKLEGKGLVRRISPRGGSPTMWALTFRGKRVG